MRTKAEDPKNPYLPDDYDPNKPAGSSSSSSQTPWNADQRPVVYTTHPNMASGGNSGIPYTPAGVTNINDNPYDAGTSVYTGVQILSDIRANDPKAYDNVISQLRAAGYLGPRSTSMTSIEGAWKQLLQDSAAVFARNPAAANVNVFDFLWERAQGGSKDPQSRGPGGPRGSGSGAYSGPVSRVTLTNEFDAKSLVNQALNQYLGRDATEDERKKFWHKLNAAEAANPDVSTPVGVAGSVQSGGFGREQFAVDYAKSRKDYAETQASTTLMGWLEESLTDPQRMV